MTESLKQIRNGICWYRGGKSKDHAEDQMIKYEGMVAIYPGWVKLAKTHDTWIPREDIEEVVEK